MNKPLPNDFEFRVFYRHLKRPMWPHWKAWKECSEQEKRQANLRVLWPDEIVLEFENRGEWEKYRKELEPHSYRAWFSGSRGDHIHVTVPELARHPKRVRNAIRKRFIAMFPGADPCKASENTLISIEAKPHHKTGKLKTLVEDHVKVNSKLPAEIVKEALEECSRGYDVPSNPVDSSWVKENKVLKFCLTHKIRGELGRHNILFRNLAVGLCQSGLSDAEIEQYGQRVVNNCIDPPQSLNAFMGWIKAYREGRLIRKEYNQYELLRWFKQNKVALDV